MPFVLSWNCPKKWLRNDFRPLQRPSMLRRHSNPSLVRRVWAHLTIHMVSVNIQSDHFWGGTTSKTIHLLGLTHCRWMQLHGSTACGVQACNHLLPGFKWTQLTQFFELEAPKRACESWMVLVFMDWGRLLTRSLVPVRHNPPTRVKNEPNYTTTSKSTSQNSKQTTAHGIVGPVMGCEGSEWSWVENL